MISSYKSKGCDIKIIFPTNAAWRVCWWYPSSDAAIIDRKWVPATLSERKFDLFLNAPSSGQVREATFPDLKNPEQELLAGLHSKTIKMFFLPMQQYKNKI